MNKVMLIGNVGAEPQVKYFEQGSCVAQIRLATTERGYTLQNGTQVPYRMAHLHLLAQAGRDYREIRTQGRQTLCRRQDTEQRLGRSSGHQPQSDRDHVRQLRTSLA